jgi:hypothetical protein
MATDTVNGSLILQDEAAANPEKDAQLFLFYAGDIPQIDRGKPQFDYTGERLFRDRPDVYRLVMTMWAEGVSKRQISRACHVTIRTIDAVIGREEIPIATHKKKSLETIARANRMLAERIEELAPTAKFGEATFAYGVTFDKLAVGTGDPTMRIEVTQPAESIYEKIGRLRDDLMKLATAHVVQNGLEGKNGGQKALVEAGSAAAAEFSGGSDVESDDSATVSQEIGETATDLVTESEGSKPNLDRQDGGGRGSDFAGHPTENQNGEGSRNFVGNGGSGA